MPLPRLAEVQIRLVIQQVAEYIDRQRQVYAARAVPLNAGHKAAMQPFFPDSTLDSARVLVITDERVANPRFYSALIKMGFELEALPNFSRMAAITFVDKVVSHVPFADRLLFHELVHVVQYQKLGLEDFANRYVRGFLNSGSYEGIPLEMNAYALDARFAEAPTKAFSVTDEVQRWIDAGKF
jgi:hypothetical protein